MVPGGLALYFALYDSERISFMRFLHIADLHFGKSLHDCSLVEEDQPYWADRFLELTDKVKPDAVLIAGDVYDRSSPSGEAVRLLDAFLTGLHERGIQVLMISGNHDSGQKLSFAERLLEDQGVHIAGIVGREIRHVTLEDQYGPVTFWLLPYIFPALVSQVLEDDSIRDYDTACRRLLAEQDIDFSGRNVLIAHQNVVRDGVEAERGGSETMIGGVGAIDYTAFDGFTYVALGHIHAAQPVGRKTVRYSGSPLCYHFSETRQSVKGPVLVELGEAGAEASIEICQIEPLHPLREIRGTYSQILEEEKKRTAWDEYLRIVLTDRTRVPDAAEKLRAFFKGKGSRVLELVHEGTGPALKARAGGDARRKSLTELFTDFYFDRSGEKLPGSAEKAIIDYAAEHAGRAGDLGEGLFPDEKQTEAFVRFILRQEDAGKGGEA